MRIQKAQVRVDKPQVRLILQGVSEKRPQKSECLQEPQSALRRKNLRQKRLHSDEASLIQWVMKDDGLSLKEGRALWRLRKGGCECRQCVQL